MQSVHGAQFLNIIPFCLSSAHFTASSVPAPAILTISLTSIYASLLSQKLEFSIEVLNLI